eukprot:1179434-Prorocentrum_minimum.AAC.1
MVTRGDERLANLALRVRGATGRATYGVQGRKAHSTAIASLVAESPVHSQCCLGRAARGRSTRWFATARPSPASRRGWSYHTRYKNLYRCAWRFAGRGRKIAAVCSIPYAQNSARMHVVCVDKGLRVFTPTQGCFQGDADVVTTM